MRVSRSGLAMAAAYTALAIGSVVCGYSLTDPEESTVLMQLPVVPVFSLLFALGLLGWAAAIPLTVFYGVSTPLIALGFMPPAGCWGRLESGQSC